MITKTGAALVKAAGRQDSMFWNATKFTGRALRGIGRWAAATLPVFGKVGIGGVNAVGRGLERAGDFAVKHPIGTLTFGVPAVYHGRKRWTDLTSERPELFSPM